MNTKAKILLVSFVAVSMTINYSALAAKEAAPTESKLLHAAKTPPSAAIKGKKWTSNEQAIKLLNIYLRSNPMTVLEIQKSVQTIRTTGATLRSMNKFASAQEEEVFVHNTISVAIDLIKPFIDTIRSNKDMIKSILEETLTHHQASQKLLLRFLVGNENIETFSKREIKTIPQLQNLLHEIEGFFADLFASMSDEVKAAYKKFIADNSKK